MVFGLLGYLMYAFLFGMLGALVSKTEDISKITPVTMIFVVSFIPFMTGMNDSSSLLMKVAFIPLYFQQCHVCPIALGSVSSVEVVISAAILHRHSWWFRLAGSEDLPFRTLMYGNPIKFTQALKKIREQ